MAVGSKHLQCVTLSAASALSAASQQFTFVNQVAAGVVPATAATDLPIGVVQNSPNRGEPALVAYKGITKLRVGGADVAVAARIGTDATGRAIALTAGTSTGYHVLGRILYIDASDNDGALVTAIVDCTAPPRNG
jgi:hypothetical protein